MPLKKKPAKKTSRGKKIIAGTLVTAAIAGAAGWWTLKSGNASFPVPAYQVEKVIDGDTFITKEKRSIRLASVSAPEIGDCGGEEATAVLTKLISGKPLYLKVLYNDEYRRLVSLVHTAEGLVNERMLREGFVYYGGTSNEPQDISRAGIEAKEKKLGIFGPNCTQTTPLNRKCVIKGNKRLRSGGDAYYRFPGCSQYDKTIVQLYLGDAWFCTEAEAKKAGFTKGADCLNKSWR